MNLKEPFLSGFEGETAPGYNGPRLDDGGGGVRNLRRNLKESVVGEVVGEETTTQRQRLLGKSGTVRNGEASRISSPKWPPK